MKLAILAVLAALGCGKAEEKFEPKEPLPPIMQRYSDAVQRLYDMLDNGWVVARGQDNKPFDEGDSLIFTGIATHALPCDYDTPLAKSFPNGQLFRHPSQPKTVSLDGALGFYIGLASRLKRCQGNENYVETFKKHFEYSVANGDKINEGSDAKVEKEFTYIRDLLAFKLGLRAQPSSDRLALLESQIALWARAVTLSKSACYRIHLGWLSFKTIELLDGSISKGGRDSFCVGGLGAGLPIVEHWCGRDDLVSWIDGFKFDEWGYRHQRCDRWEQPDGNGRRQPGVDYLVAIREAYKLP